MSPCTADLRLKPVDRAKVKYQSVIGLTDVVFPDTGIWTAVCAVALRCVRAV